MIEQRPTNLVQLRPRSDTIAISQGRTVLSTGRDGFISDGAEHGLFVNQTRLLSRYRYLIDGQPPQPNASANVEQHSWLGYYITLPPGTRNGKPDQGSGQVPQAAEQTLELRLSRYVGGGVHEDVDLTNFTQQPTAFRLELEVAADFADQSETGGERQQQGELTAAWREAGADAWELTFDYRAEHSYDQRGNQGRASIHRAVTLRIEHATSAPAYDDGRIA